MFACLRTLQGMREGTRVFDRTGDSIVSQTITSTERGLCSQSRKTWKLLGAKSCMMAR